MTYRMKAFGLASMLVVTATASVVHAQNLAQSTPSGLTASIRQTIANERANAASDPMETMIATAVADIIVTANIQPVQALGAVRLAIAEEGCLFEGDSWNRWGCAGLASVAASIQQAIATGPAATVGDGGPATPPPAAGPGGGGADYRSPIGG